MRGVYLKVSITAGHQKSISGGAAELVHAAATFASAVEKLMRGVCPYGQVHCHAEKEGKASHNKESAAPDVIRIVEVWRNLHSPDNEQSED